MKTVLYISNAKAMELVYEHFNGDSLQFANTFNAIRDEGLQFTLKNGMILMKSISSGSRHRYIITAP